MDNQIMLLIAFLLGGMVIGSLIIGVLFTDTGKPSDTLEKIDKAIKRFKGVVKHES